MDHLPLEPDSEDERNAKHLQTHSLTVFLFDCSRSTVLGALDQATAFLLPGAGSSIAAGRACCNDARSLAKAATIRVLPRRETLIKTFSAADCSEPTEKCRRLMSLFRGNSPRVVWCAPEPGGCATTPPKGSRIV